MSFIYKEETYNIIGICMDVHRTLGKGFMEIVYKDALEYEFNKANIPFQREKEFLIHYKDTILKHKFFVDFVVYNDIILEIKAIRELNAECYKQLLNYLNILKCPLGMLINFGESSLKYKRLAN